MLKDRGTVKWTSLMLPEHVELLKGMWREDQKVNMPILDEQELEMINQQVVAASQLKHVVTLSVYEDGTVKKYCGRITALNKNMNTINLYKGKNIKITIPFKNIISIC